MFNDFNQLRCFITLAEELHFGRAAARLYMTQPPLSRQIRLRVESLGVRRLDRTSRMVRLTEAGAAFLLAARQMLTMAELSVDTARRIHKGSAGRVALGFTAVSGYWLIPELLGRVQRALPDIDIALKEMVTSDQIAALNAGTIALAMMRPAIAEQEGLIHRRYHREPMVLALPVGHPLAERAQIGPEDLRHQPMIAYAPDEGRYFYEMTLELLAETLPPPRIVQYIGQTHSIMALVNAGMGIALVPASVRYLGFSNVVCKTIWPTLRRAETWLAWRNAPATAAEAALRDFILGSLPGADAA